MTGARVRVQLVLGEYVAPRGHKKVSWLVRRADAWVPAGTVPGAVTESLAAGPGTIWESSVTLDLDAGAEVVRVISAPRAEQRSVLDYLAAAPPRAESTTRRTTFRVKADGQLAAVARDGDRR